MIDLSQKLIASLIFCSAACGFCLGAIYELVRFVRCMLSPTAKRASGARGALVLSVTFITDFLFLMLFAVCGILITFEICGGVFRGVVYFGMALGLLLYRIMFGRLTSRVILWLCKALKKILRGLARLVLVPLRAIKNLFVKLYTLTIGRIIGRIKERAIVKRLERLLVLDTAEKSDAPPTALNSSDKEYKKEGRISFGGKQNSR